MGLLPRRAFRGTFAAICTSTAICMAGCNALTGADALVVEDRETALSSGSTPGPPDRGDGDATLEASSSSGTSGSASSSTSSSSSSSGELPPEDAGGEAPPPPSGTFIDATFPNAEACMGSVATNGASKTYEASGRTSGACRVCAITTGEMFLELTGTAPKQGQATFEAYAKRAPGATTPATAAIQFKVGGSSVSSSDDVGDTWVKLGGGSISVQNGTTVVVRVGVSSAKAGDCLVIDDVRVAVP